MTNLRQLAERATERERLRELIDRCANAAVLTDAILAAGFRAPAATEGDRERATSIAEGWHDGIKQELDQFNIDELTDAIAAALASAKAEARREAISEIAHGQHPEWEERAKQAEAEVDALRKHAIAVMASLAAAISLLERGGKKAAPSNKMFAQMLVDYKRALEDARAALSGGSK